MRVIGNALENFAQCFQNTIKRLEKKIGSMKKGNKTIKFEINELNKSMEYYGKYLEDKVNDYDPKINVANSEAVQHVVA